MKVRFGVARLVGMKSCCGVSGSNPVDSGSFRRAFASPLLAVLPEDLTNTRVGRHRRRKIWAGSRLLIEYPLECEAEGLRSGRRSLTIAGIHVRQGGIKRAMAQVLAYQKSVSAGADHELSGSVFEHVRVL